MIAVRSGADDFERKGYELIKRAMEQCLRNSQMSLHARWQSSILADWCVLILYQVAPHPSCPRGTMLVPSL